MPTPWRKALEGFDVMESTIVNEWKAEARREGELKGFEKGELKGFEKGELKGFEKGELKGFEKGERLTKVEMLLRLIHKRHGSVPEDLVVAIRACEDSTKFDGWIDATVTASSLDEFRRITGL